MSYPLINKDGSHYSATFSNIITPSAVNPRILPQPSTSVHALRGILSGGRRTRTKKRRMYKNKKMGSRGKGKNKRKTMRKKRRLRGGYSQYQSNLPMTQVYSTGAPIGFDPSDSALANPVPHQVLSNCTNCVDNYDLYTNSGFPSRGWY